MNKLKSESPSSIEDHLAALYGRINYERQLKVTPRHFKLQNMREILRRLDDPHLKYPVIHVAGTKGKGSTCTMLGQVLTASGRRTGVYTSPHLETIHQRMAIDGKLITDDQLVNALATLWPVIDAMDAESVETGFRPLTFFEITTAAAFLHFAAQKCDAVVLEVGLGGRLDSTNVCQPTTCIITNISVDHTRQLGSTVDKIAFEKAGIIKDSIPVVSGAADPLAAKVIAEVAADKNAQLFLLDQDFEITEEDQSDDHLFNFSGRVSLRSDQQPRENQERCESDSESDPAAKTNSTRTKADLVEDQDYKLNDLKLGMLGHHQRINAAITIAAIKTLNDRGWEISEEAIRTGLSRASLCGRTEVLSQSPTIVIDMAHNDASINALVETLRDDLPSWKSSSKGTLILALSREKEANKILKPLVAAFDEIVLTKYQDNPRGRCEAELLELARAIQTDLQSNSKPAAELRTAPDPQTAWKSVASNLTTDKSVCITGSAFLVAELRNTVLAAMENKPSR